MSLHVCTFIGFFGFCGLVPILSVSISVATLRFTGSVGDIRRGCSQSVYALPELRKLHPDLISFYRRVSSIRFPPFRFRTEVYTGHRTATVSASSIFQASGHAINMLAFAKQ